MSQLSINTTLAAIFARTTNALKKDGATTVTAGNVRYENVIDPIVVDKQRKWDRGTHLRTTASGNILSLSPVPAFSRASNAYDQIGNTYANNTPRYGTTVNVLGATNLMSANESSFESGTAGVIKGTGVVISQDSTKSYAGTSSLKVVTPGSVAGEGWQINKSWPVGITYTAQLRITGSGSVRLRVSDNIAVSPATSYVTLDGTWQLLTVSITPTSSSSAQTIMIETQNTVATTFWIDAVQFEQNPSATPWVLGGTNRPTTYLQDSVLIEEGSTNTVLWSEQFDNAYYTKNACSVTANAIYAPNGTLTADKFLDSAANTAHYLTSSGPTVGSIWTYSIYAKAAEYGWLCIDFSSAGLRGYFNVAAGTIGTLTGVTAKMTYVGDGWYRISATTTSNTIATGVNLIVTNADQVQTVNGTGTSGIYIWGAQAEQKAYPTSYIPTTSASVSRSAESLTLNPAGILNPSSCSMVLRFYADGELVGNSSISRQYYLIDHRRNILGTGNQNLVALFKNTDGYWNFYTGDANASFNPIASSVNIAKGFHTIGVRWVAGERSLWMDGAKIAFDVPTKLPSNTETYLDFGGGTPSSWCNSFIEEINVFNTNLSDVDMINYTQASGYIIPMRAETTWKASFNGNLNFATSGVYVSEWFNAGASGAIFASYTAPNNAASGNVYLYEFQTSDSDTQATTSSWVSNLASVTGKYIRFRITMVSSVNQSNAPTTTSMTITPADTSKSATIEEGTANLFAAPAAPASELIGVTPGSSYTLSTYGVDSSSGSVVANHYDWKDTQADFQTGTLVNAAGVADNSGSLTSTPHADPTFSRASAATKRDGTQVQSGYLRFEDVIKNAVTRTQSDWEAGTKTNMFASPGSYVQDVKRYESMMVNNSADWTSGGDTAGTITWNVTNQRLEFVSSSTTSQSTYTYNNFLTKDVSVEVTALQSQDGGIIARYVDNNNYYLLRTCDDSGVTPSSNITLLKRVAGTFTAITSIDTTWVRGTPHTIRFEIVGSELKAYFDGALVVSAFDTAITSAGKVGLRTNSTVSEYYTSTKIAQITPGGKLTVGQFIDGFDIDSSNQYTNGGLTAGTNTWNTAQSRLEMISSGTGQSTLIYNNFSAKDMAVEAVVTRAYDSGIVARYVDANNYYTLFLHDDTANATTNIRIDKCVGGVFSAVVSAVDITFVRGTAYTFRFEVVGSELKGYQNGVLVISGTDASITSAGKAGLRCNDTGGIAGFYVNSFTIDMLSPLFSRPSVANLITDGSSAAKNLPRYESGRNLIPKDFSDMEGSAVWSDNLTNSHGYDTTYAWQGTHSLKFNGTVGTGLFMRYNKCVVGKTYTLSCYARAGVNGLALHLGDSPINSSTVLTNTGWTRCVATFTATQNSHVLSFYNDTYFGGAANDFWIDGVQLEEGSTATTWNPGGPSAIMVEEGTSNILSFVDGQFTMGTGHWASQSGSSWTTASGQVDPFGGNNAYRCQTSGGTSTIKMYAGVITDVLNQKYSASVWIKNNSAVDATVVLQDANGAAGYVQSQTVSQSQGWVLAKCQGVVGNGAALQFIFSAPTSGQNIDITVMNPQVENKPYCTSYVTPANTRADEQLKIPVTSLSTPTAGTIIVRAYVDGELTTANTTKQYELILHDSNPTVFQSAIRIVRDAGVGSAWFAQTGNGGNLSSASSGFTIPVGWHTFGIRWSSSELSLWVDGTKKAFLANPAYLPNSLSGYMCVGCSYTGSRNWNFPIDEINMFPVALSDPDMQNYTSL